jgi:hypothetical protein
MARKAPQAKPKLAPVKKGGAKNPVGAPKMKNPLMQCKDSNKSRKRKRLLYGRRYNLLSISFGI